MAAVRRRRPDRQGGVGADTRADQSARAGTADRRVVFEVTNTQGGARPSTCSGRPEQGRRTTKQPRRVVAAVSPQLVRPAAGGWRTTHAGLEAGAAGPWRKDKAMLWKGF